MSERRIAITRQSEMWEEGDRRLVEAVPLYLDEERIKDMRVWAIYVTLDTICRDLSRRLLELLREPGSYTIKEGHLEVTHEAFHLHHCVRASMAFVVEEDGGQDVAI